MFNKSVYFSSGYWRKNSYRWTGLNLLGILLRNSGREKRWLISYKMLSPFHDEWENSARWSTITHSLLSVRFGGREITLNILLEWRKEKLVSGKCNYIATTKLTPYKVRRRPVSNIERLFRTSWKWQVLEKAFNSCHAGNRKVLHSSYQVRSYRKYFQIGTVVRVKNGTDATKFVDISVDVKYATM